MLIKHDWKPLKVEEKKQAKSRSHKAYIEIEEFWSTLKTANQTKNKNKSLQDFSLSSIQILTNLYLVINGNLGLMTVFSVIARI